MGNWETVLEMQKAYNEGWTIGSAEKEKQYSPYVEKSA